LWESRSPPDIIIKRSYSLTSVMGCAPFLFGRKSSEFFLPNSLMK
jgi:hypothetical protein